MEFLNLIFYPLILILGYIFSLFSNIFLNYPLVAIVLFGAFISLLLMPLQKPLRAIEIRTTEVIKNIEDEFQELSKNLNREEQFFLKESLYKKHSYNPFYSIKQAASFFVSIPFLISVIILFNNSSFINSSSFFEVPLNSPDGLLFGLNLFPIIMFITTYIDSQFRYRSDPSSKTRFLLISLALFFLVYGLSSALIIFWIAMNFMNMTLFYFKKN